jgi:hypothetical protein
MTPTDKEPTRAAMEAACADAARYAYRLNKMCPNHYDCSECDKAHEEHEAHAVERAVAHALASTRAAATGTGTPSAFCVEDRYANPMSRSTPTFDWLEADRSRKAQDRAFPNSAPHRVLRLYAAPPSPSTVADAVSVDKVTRVVLVDHSVEFGHRHYGRYYDKWNVRAQLSLQDDGRTLKVFVSSPAPVVEGTNDSDVGVWYRSAVSGLLYRERGAAGDISSIRIDGVEFKVEAPAPSPKPVAGTGEKCGSCGGTKYGPRD